MQLVRALDGHVSVVHRGRAAHFWNCLGAHYQAEAARPEARRAKAAAVAAAEAAAEAGVDDEGTVDADEACAQGSLKPGDCIAV